MNVDFRKREKSSGEFRRCGRTCKRDFGVGEIREWGVVKRGRRAMEEEVGKVDGWVSSEEDPGCFGRQPTGDW